MPATVGTLIDRALTAFGSLAEVGDAVIDEHQYVTDLGIVWRARLGAVSAARGPEIAGPEVEAAVDTAIAEAARITDPHRAIDWLSTLPQVVLIAIGEPT